MTALLDVSDLTRSYGEKEVIADVTFTVDPGERLVVLGHNGAGKSTLLELIATLREPTAGAVVLGGFDVQRDTPGARRLIGMTPQSQALDQAATPVEVLRFQARALGMRPADARARAEELIAQFGLEEHANRRIAKLSGGTRRKVDLAVALTGRPELVILDEPTTGLDPVARQEFHAALRALSERGTALVVSTQDLHEAEQLATRILVLRHGRVVADDAPARLKSTVGERVLLVRSHDPDRLSAALGPSSIRRAGDDIQLSVGGDNGSLAAALSSLIPHADLVEDLSVAPPSLDDVFLALAVG